jgi:hypothetical protein
MTHPTVTGHYAATRSEEVNYVLISRGGVLLEYMLFQTVLPVLLRAGVI